MRNGCPAGSHFFVEPSSTLHAAAIWLTLPDEDISDSWASDLSHDSSWYQLENEQKRPKSEAISLLVGSSTFPLSAY